MSTLFGEDIAAKSTAGEPTEEELGEAIDWAVKLVINKHLIGEPPASMDKKDLAYELIEPTLKRCRKWRAGGKFPLNKFAFVSARHALTDYMRKTHQAAQREQTATDALELAAAEFVIYGDELRKYQLAKALFASLRASAGRDLFENGVVNLSELDRVF